MRLPFSHDPLPEDHISTTEAAKLAKVHPVLLCRWVRKGRLRAWKLVGRVRVSRADVLALAVPVEERPGLPARPRKLSPRRREEG